MKIHISFFFSEILTIGIRHQLSKIPKISNTSEDFKTPNGELKPQILDILKEPKPFNGFSLKLVKILAIMMHSMSYIYLDINFCKRAQNENSYITDFEPQI